VTMATPSNAEIKDGGTEPPFPHTTSWHSSQLVILRDNSTFIRHLSALFARKGQKFRLPSMSPRPAVKGKAVQAIREDRL
jgi:hypothetical protein